MKLLNITTVPSGTQLRVNNNNLLHHAISIILMSSKMAEAD